MSAPVSLCYWTRHVSLCYWTRSKFQVARDLGAKELASVSHCVASFFNVLSSTVRPRLATNPAIRICLPHETLVVRYCTLSLHSVCTCTNLGASHDLRALPTTESGYFEASVVMWHNQRVINTPNHRYNYASDPRAIAVCPTCNLCLRWTLFAAIWVIWTLSTVRSPRTHPVARRSRGARRA